MIRVALALLLSLPAAAALTQVDDPFAPALPDAPSPERLIGEKATVGGRTSPDGSCTVTCDLPDSEHLKNVGGSDGAGLCVFTSISHSARWQNEPVLENFRDWMRKYPGGGYPEKVTKMIEKISGEKHGRVDWVQFTNSDPAMLDLAMKTGRMPGVTYGYSERYGGPISHMVNLAYFGEHWAAILDNNFPGTFEWMSRDEFLRRWKMGGGGWAVVLLRGPPPPVPVNCN